jgi:hypothetical protein
MEIRRVSCSGHYILRFNAYGYTEVDTDTIPKTNETAVAGNKNPGFPTQLSHCSDGPVAAY